MFNMLQRKTERDDKRFEFMGFDTVGNDEEMVMRFRSISEKN